MGSHASSDTVNTSTSVTNVRDIGFTGANAVTLVDSLSRANVAAANVASGSISESLNLANNVAQIGYQELHSAIQASNTALATVAAITPNGVQNEQGNKTQSIVLILAAVTLVMMVEK